MKLKGMTKPKVALSLLGIAGVARTGTAACQCDGTDFKGATCSSLGFRAGNLACNPDCTINTSQCVNNQPTCSPGSSPAFSEKDGKLFWDFSGSSTNRGHKCNKNFGPSDAVVHPKLNKLVVVSDEGEYALISLDGTSAQCFNSPGDNEVVMVADPTSDKIYIGQEFGLKGPGFAQVTEVDATNGQADAIWQFAFPGGILNAERGMEAGVFVPDNPSVPAEGTFYFGDQSAGVIVGQCHKPTTQIFDNLNCGMRIDVRAYGMKEVTSLSYDAASTIGGSTNGVMYVGSSQDKQIMAFAPNGTFLKWAAEFPRGSGPGQEGTAIYGCQMFIAQDANKEGQKVWSYPFMTKGSCSDGKQNQDEVCVDVGGVCGNYNANKETDCGDGVDNDCDGFIDSADQDCVGVRVPSGSSNAVVSQSSSAAQRHAGGPEVCTAIALAVGGLISGVLGWY